MKTQRYILLSSIVALLSPFFFYGCGKENGQRLSFPHPVPDQYGKEPENGNPQFTQNPLTYGASPPDSLPVDRLQPWERVDENGYVIVVGHDFTSRGETAENESSTYRQTSAINLETDFTPGVQRFNEVGDVTDFGEASRFASGSVGEELLSYATFRISLGSNQPSALSFDVNPRLRSDATRSEYYVAISDYANSVWKWFGPFTDSHVRLVLPPSDYTSELGNSFIIVSAFNGSNFDLTGIGVNPRDETDSAPPPVPPAPTVTPIPGGVFIQFVSVIADDLAGYRIGYAPYEFSSPNDFLVEFVNYVEGISWHLLPDDRKLYVRVSAVDVNGNESALSEASLSKGVIGAIPTLELTTDTASAMRGSQVNLNAVGAEVYDFDLNGDGFFEQTDLASGNVSFIAQDSGIIRPAVRGRTAGGGIGFAAVSLIITSNSRPSASASATPSSGKVPLDVTFTGVGEDSDGTIVNYAWDFDGDGFYDYSDPTNPNPPVQTYTTEGLYNVKFRVEDNEGAWDVDTISIQVQPDPANQMPTIAAISATPSLTMPLMDVFFDVVATDSDGTIVSYAWDFENDGTDDSFIRNPQFQFPSVGLYNVRVQVTDDLGGYAVGYVTVGIVEAPLNIPPTIVEITASQYYGPPPLDVIFSTNAFDTDGNIVQYGWDFENDGILDFTDPLSGDTSHTYASPGFYVARFQVTDDGGDASSAYLGINVMFNQPPSASLALTPTCVYLGETGFETVTFDASSSYDPEGGTLEYAFDPLGNGSYTAFSTTPTYTYDYSFTGTFNVGLRVKDAQGAVSENSRPLSVYRFGSVVVEDNRSYEGTDISLAVVNGFPALSLVDDFGNLYYIRALDGTGLHWGSMFWLDSSSSFGGTSLKTINGYPAISYRKRSGNATGQFTSQAIVNGNPAISYYDALNGDLMYVRALDINGNSWGTPVPVDTTNSVGSYNSLFVVNGNPAISYFDETNGDLWYVRASDTNGATWGTPVAVDTVNYVGLFTSLRVINGNPAISYYDSSNGDLLYVRASDADGTTWGTPVTVDSSFSTGLHTSLTIVNGNPAISYFDWSNYDLKYVRALDANGVSWGTPVTVDGADTLVGEYTSLAVVNGNPGISYRSLTEGALKFVRSQDADGGTWGAPVTVDASDFNGFYTSLEVVNGNPAISYYSSTLGDLRYVRAQDTDGTSWGTPSSPDFEGDTGEYSFLLVVNGNPSISYFDGSSGSLKFVRALDASGGSWGDPIQIDKFPDTLRFISATDANGSSWSTPVDVVTQTDAGSYNSMESVSGNPAITYYDSINGDLMYVRASAPDGSVWDAPISLDTTGDVGLYTSLELVNGFPAVSYFDRTNGDLKFIRATDANGSAWGSPTAVHTAGVVGKYSSLAVIAGNPAIGYYDVTNHDVLFVRAADANGSAWNPPHIADDSGDVGKFCSLANVNGYPALSYYDATNGDLKFAIASAFDGSSWKSPVTVYSYTDVGTWTSIALVNGRPGIAYENEYENVVMFGYPRID